MGPGNGSHGASGGILGTGKSPYLGQAQVTQVTASGGMKKRLEKENSTNSGVNVNAQPRNSKKESLLSNAAFKNQILSG